MSAMHVHICGLVKATFVSAYALLGLLDITLAAHIVAPVALVTLAAVGYEHRRRRRYG